MSENTERLVPTPGQTIGPFYGYALPYDNFSQTATGIGFQLTQSIPFSLSA